MSIPEEALQRHVDEQAESAKLHYQERWATNYAALQTGDEREAELLLAGYLLTIIDGYEKVEFRAAWDVHSDPAWGTIMGYRVKVGGHTADFLFRCCQGDDRRLLAVTLDARDGRQRAPEAIARDRGLMDATCRVMNYTDAQVLARPTDIADEISEALSDLVEEMLAAAGYIRGSRPSNVTPIGQR
ncbi:hypothetical protein [Rhodospirillum rubrum]|uniref:Uncharacterized protein n=1 Tax=Rhodospirillum rubrum (strain ATCC 11170 / ATH 1.1.1 / DSM 467 / LMG 4362 / NCIMB 8255 / S1) TaxID=269796 RepID=Q2RS47_RHORT|nr:hypothetical protein [Rhodospirillum rubrum]ABC23048.1 hypothetical protein Rru_A2248 [Rhodospirillum rubrum ATCC 11170]AEO48777.1 hypothetical protein F11_11565 [Rhodospirillum rubrum F11]MBK5954675.1 hypothetical protein [Rhodospirillum rubrum]QXG79032.1 hypothetical protein KUL73_11615 [Rhodospirillum rubrum]HAP99198.1 hypothetical protein [Rhodospirillum rubrum]